MKLNMKKWLFACMTSLVFMTSTAFAEDNSDHEQILREIADCIAGSQDIQDKIQAGASWEDVQKMIEDLKPLDLSSLGLPAEEGQRQGASMTGSMTGGVNGAGGNLTGGGTTNLNLELAKLQMQLANTNKDAMSSYMKEIESLQKEQTRTSSFLNQARQIQSSAESSRKSIAMPDTMKYYMDTNKISYPKSKQDSLYSAEQWRRIADSLETYAGKTGMRVQSLMVKIQDSLGQYNTCSQGALGSIQSGYTMQGISRGQSLFSERGGAVDTKPIATSMVAGVLIGMFAMWGILKKKGWGAGTEEHS